MFGLSPIEHNERYERVSEFTTIMRRLWAHDDELSFRGRWWQTEGAFVARNPRAGQ